MMVTFIVQQETCRGMTVCAECGLSTVDSGDHTTTGHVTIDCRVDSSSGVDLDLATPTHEDEYSYLKDRVDEWLHHLFIYNINSSSVASEVLELFIQVLEGNGKYMHHFGLGLKLSTRSNTCISYNGCVILLVILLLWRYVHTKRPSKKGRFLVESTSKKLLE